MFNKFLTTGLVAGAALVIAATPASANLQTDGYNENGDIDVAQMGGVRFTEDVADYNSRVNPNNTVDVDRVVFNDGSYAYKTQIIGNNGDRETSYTLHQPEMGSDYIIIMEEDTAYMVDANEGDVEADVEIEVQESPSYDYNS